MIAFSLVLWVLVKWEHANADFNFDLCAWDYAHDFAREHGRSLEWFDIYARNPHMKGNDYAKFHISANTDRVTYGTISRNVERPGYVYSQWFHNGGSTAITGKLIKTKTMHNSFSWSIEESLKIGVGIKVDAGLPGIISGNVDIQTSVELGSTQSKQNSEDEVISIEHEVTVPPGKSVKATLTITDTDVEMPWEADVFLTGYIALWLEPQYNGHWLWFHPAWKLFSCDGGNLLQVYGNGLRYKARGTFHGVRAMRSSVRVQEYRYNLYEDPTVAPLKSYTALILCCSKVNQINSWGFPVSANSVKPDLLKLFRPFLPSDSLPTLRVTPPPMTSCTPGAIRRWETRKVRKTSRPASPVQLVPDYPSEAIIGFEE